MLLDFINLTKSKGKSIYIELYEQINNAIKSGKIQKGERLPSIREASLQLKCSRTTVENAYLKLCIQGTVESVPQKGYYICSSVNKLNTKTASNISGIKIKYDFSSQSIDKSSADTGIWTKNVRNVLCNSEILTSYGDPQGEFELREVLADYSYKARGVLAKSQNIVIGAGVGPLLNILCSLLNKNLRVGIENGGFIQAESIFNDYGIKCENLHYDKNGAFIKEIEENNIDVLFLLPSLLGKISVSSLLKRRNDYILWADKYNERWIIEDDYNGELRYTARSITALQGKNPEKIIYIGSFSKLLLPSVRIAYMVLPDELCNKFQQRKKYYNQTCGKIEQLALKSYIETGAMEKHLRKLRKLYNNKSRILIKYLIDNIKCIKDIEVYETSLTIKISTGIKLTGKEISEYLLKSSIKTLYTDKNGEVLLCFAGISIKDMESAVIELAKNLNNLYYK